MIARCWQTRLCSCWQTGCSLDRFRLWHSWRTNEPAVIISSQFARVRWYHSQFFILLTNHSITSTSAICTCVHTKTTNHCIVEVDGLAARVVQVNWRMCTMVVKDAAWAVSGFVAWQTWSTSMVLFNATVCEHISFSVARMTSWYSVWCLRVCCLLAGVVQQRSIIIRLTTGWPTRLSVTS